MKAVFVGKMVKSVFILNLKSITMKLVSPSKQRYGFHKHGCQRFYLAHAIVWTKQPLFSSFLGPFDTTEITTPHHELQSNKNWRPVHVKGSTGARPSWVFPTSPAVSHMSGSSNLDSFHDGWWVAVQLLFCRVLPPGLSCIIAVKLFLQTFS